MNLSVILLAGGETPGMASDIPKALHKICGLPMLEWEIRALEDIGGGKPLVITGYPAQALEEALPDRADLIEQTPWLASGNALMRVKDHIKPYGHVLVTAGDMPLLRPETLKALCEKAENAAAAVLRAADKEPRQPDSDAIACCFAVSELLPALDALECGPQRAYSLQDILALLSKNGKSVALHEAPGLECLSVNNRVELSVVTGIVRAQIAARHMLGGVTIVDPSHTYIDAGVTIGRDTVLYPGCILEGKTRIGSRCTITQGSRIVDSVIGDGTVVQGSLLVQASIGESTQIGPFVHIRPNTRIGSRCRLGNFVEIKNSNIADEAKVSHLTYVGDGDVGENVNIGCGVVFSNYDGVKKHRTVIEKNAFIGCNTNLVPPVTVGENAFIAAGSTITENVPPGALGIARARQVNKEGWKTRRDAIYKKE